MRRRRKLTPFSLSFLDIMSCGFGAVVLLFLIIKHNVDHIKPEPAPATDLSSEVNLLENEIREGRENLAQLRNTIDEVDREIVIAEGRARRIMEEIKESSGRIEALSSDAQTTEIEKLKEEIREMEERKKRLEAETEETGRDVRTFIGEGNRQYLTGLKLGGQRVLVLLDASASMLDDTIVNVIRRRNMSDQAKQASAKWQQALKTADWLSTQFQPGSRYQIYTFNTEAKAVLADSDGQWLRVNDSVQLNKAVSNMKDIIPHDGTSLEKAFLAAASLKPLPDNIYLITDGLPTQGRSPPRASTVSSKQRMGYFEDAVKQLPSNIPVNIILAPMEGDPMAPSAFWRLAQLTRGSFLTPSKDWP
ncbi:MAG: VWA domain-containing protein [Gammaproteobacteria bacterium]